MKCNECNRVKYNQ
ncbi:TPA: hypothetical protein IWL27_002866, partial [Enterococcus faecium]|nr:hypothetical protein [Enterococcus faecium]HAP9719064.1 hypothetical protein [Enterococcus faecium]